MQLSCQARIKTNPGCCSTETLQDIEKIVGQAKHFVELQRWAMLNASATFYQKTFARRFNGILNMVIEGPQWPHECAMSIARCNSDNITVQ